MSTRDEINTLIRIARDFLKTAEFQMGNGMYDLAVFNLEQALQFFLKAKILEYGAQYPRAHSVRYLLRFLRDIVPNDKRQIVSELLDRYLFELGVLEDAILVQGTCRGSTLRRRLKG
ncbi:HEPN domain-containing protein [Vulcanisaeta sp. JCM 14467]|uniref:HEPN domain-containing protein n=1 Tax=Vulcanisaeta sp. JCM 14467 TaxID=1295370 RepID=UPI000B045A5B|nr:HEPN domain-containing protein [Vulcanisaeta sp. JCM 14467]